MKRLLWGLCVCMVALALAPAVALARDYDVVAVDIEATLETDGSLAVVERRTFAFDGSFNGIYWDLQEGAYQGHEVKSGLESVRVVGTSDVAFEENDSEEPGTYTLTDEEGCQRLKLMWPATDESVTFEVAYRLSDVATRWADCAELYWQYVPADEGSGKEWKNVTCTIRLPVPPGEHVIPGENVRAWAHGPLDGELRFEGNDLIFFSPGVGYAEFLEARVTMPAVWLAEANPSSEPKLDAILEEEAAWAKEANDARLRARLAYWGIPAAMIVLAVASAVAAALYVKGVFLRLKARPSFRDKYFRDVPSDDHPAVLGMLYNGGTVSGTEFTATLMSLVDQGKIELDKVWVEKLGKNNKTEQVSEWRLTRVHTPVQKRAYAFAKTDQSKKIDDAAMSFLYDTLAANKSLDPSLKGAHREPYVLSSFFDDVANKAKREYRNGYECWSDAVHLAYARQSFETTYDSSELYPGLLGFADFALAVVLGFVGMVCESQDILLTVGVIALFAAGIYCVMVNDEGPRTVCSQKGAELKAKLKALRRWLLDFTRLREAIPTDVVLWNRLLVMATVLGVAEQVIKQLKVYAPQILEDTDFDAYAWHREDDSAAAVLAGAAVAITASPAVVSSASSHSYSSSNLSSSRDSSSRGSGGGFSSGGGGGFSGGGGRGGAF